MDLFCGRLGTKAKKDSVCPWEMFIKSGVKLEMFRTRSCSSAQADRNSVPKVVKPLP